MCQTKHPHRSTCWKGVRWHLWISSDQCFVSLLSPVTTGSVVTPLGTNTNLGPLWVHITAASLLITAPGFTQSVPVTRLSRSNKTFYDLHFIILSSILAVFLWFSWEWSIYTFCPNTGTIVWIIWGYSRFIWKNVFTVSAIAWGVILEQFPHFRVHIDTFGNFLYA